MPRKQFQWSKENPLGRGVRNVLEDFYKRGLMLRNDLLAGKYSSVQSDSVIFAWKNDLRSALFLADQDVLSGSSVYLFIAPDSLELSINSFTRAEGFSGHRGLVKMLEVIEAFLDGTFEPQISIRDSITLAYDGHILIDQHFPYLSISPRKRSLPYKILNAFYKEPSIKRIAQRDISSSFDIEIYVDWVSHLCKVFHCTKVAIENVIYRQNGFVNTTENFEIIHPL